MLVCEKSTAKDQRTKYNEIDRVEREVSMVEQKITAIAEKSAVKLRVLLDEAKLEHDIIIAGEQETLHNQVYPEAKRRKAEYLAYWCAINDQVSKIKGIRAEFLNACHAIGVRDYDRMFHLIPTLNLVANIDGIEKMLAPTEREILDAFNFGKVQPYIKLWILTDGRELIEDNNKAQVRVNELMKDGGKQDGR